MTCTVLKLVREGHAGIVFTSLGHFLEVYIWTSTYELDSATGNFFLTNTFCRKYSVELFSLCGTLYQYLVLATIDEILISGGINSCVGSSSPTLLTYSYDNSVLSEMHAPLHTFHALSNFFHIWSETSKATHSAKQAKKKEKSQSGSVITIQPSTGQFPYTSSSQSPTRVAFCCCQKGSWSTWCSSNYSLPSSRFLPVPHLFLSPLCPFSLPAVTSAEAVFSPSIAAQQTGKHCR